MEEKKPFLVTLLVNVVRVRNQTPDQARYLAVVKATDEADARRLIQPLEKEFGAASNIAPIDLLDDFRDLPDSLKRYCKQGGFELALVASSRQHLPPHS
jgi:hypothetical protein